jgi:hypothetical protein
MMDEIRIVCDMAALHPKHPVSMITGFTRRVRGADGWLCAPLHAQTVRRIACSAVLEGNAPLDVDKNEAAAIVAGDYSKLENAREVFHLECRLCHQSTLDIREEKLFAILDRLRHAEIRVVTLAELHSIIQVVASNQPDGRE